MGAEGNNVESHSFGSQRSRDKIRRRRVSYLAFELCDEETRVVGAAKINRFSSTANKYRFTMTARNEKPWDDVTQLMNK